MAVFQRKHRRFHPKPTAIIEATVCATIQKHQLCVKDRDTAAAVVEEQEVYLYFSFVIFILYTCACLSDCGGIEVL